MIYSCLFPLLDPSSCTSILEIISLNWQPTHNNYKQLLSSRYLLKPNLAFRSTDCNITKHFISVSQSVGGKFGKLIWYFSYLIFVKWCPSTRIFSEVGWKPLMHLGIYKSIFVRHSQNCECVCALGKWKGEICGWNRRICSQQLQIKQREACTSLSWLAAVERSSQNNFAECLGIHM